MKYLNLNIIAIVTVLFLSHNTFCMQRNDKNTSSSETHKMSLGYILSPSENTYQQRVEYANGLEKENHALAQENDRTKENIQRLLRAYAQLKNVDKLRAELSAVQEKNELDIKTVEKGLLVKKYALGLSNRNLAKETRIQATPRNGAKRRKISHIK